MRIALDMSNLSSGGSISILLRYMKRWIQNDDLQISVFYSREIIRSEIERSKLPVELVPVCIDYPAWKTFLFRCFKLGKLIENHGCKVIYTVNSMLLVCNLPQVVHMRNLQHFHTPSLWRQFINGGVYEVLRDWICRYSIRHAAACVYVSNYLKSTAAPWIPYKRRERQYVIHNPAPEIALGDSWDSDCNFRSNIILAIANDYPHKDITTIFKTLAILRATDPDRNWLLCVLGEGAWHAHYGPILHELQIESAVLFPGYVTSSDIAQYFRQAFALITASRLEAFNNTPLEAMGYGIPAIASNCCAHPEVVGTAGVLIEPGDSNAFAIAIHSLANDHAAYIEMVNRGRKHIEFFRIDDMADNFMEIIQQTTLSMEKKCSKKKHC